MREAIQKIKEQREIKAVSLSLLPVSVQKPALREGKAQSHGLHQPEQLSDLIIGKGRAEEEKCSPEAHDTAFRELPRKAVQKYTECRVQQQIDRDNPAEVVFHQRELHPRHCPVHKAAARGVQRKDIFQKALLPPAGPHIEIVHVEP